MLLESMGHSLRLPLRHIVGWARKASHAYATYEIPKRKGGSRTIHHPARELKTFQRWLLQHVIASWPVHPAATGYRQGRSIEDNAQAHVQSRYLIKLDLADFFPSIRVADVRAYLAGDPPGTGEWTGTDREMFCEFVCRYDRLTIGAPTSPALSNALLFQLDGILGDIAAQRHLVYTRYADDLFFSSFEPNVLSDVEELVAVELTNLTVPGDLTLNRSKTRHLSRKQRRLVTGLVLGSAGELSIGRPRKRYIRRQIHRWSALTPTERSELKGLLAFVRGVEPDFINSLILKYGTAAIDEAEQRVIGAT